MKTGPAQVSHHLKLTRDVAAPELFCERFQNALKSCLRRRFSIAECFGVIWMETLETVPLRESDQARLYEELIQWAKHEFNLEMAQNMDTHLGSASSSSNRKAAQSSSLD